ncbi:hypothetical protein [Bacillus sp. AFS040349]|uniref:hypothetical protein n=1 Tax=Bacillus sp. AFS040349 TaxID=2033502 RepID=UPI000BFD0C53|nr:hypothetical protein [Bacillus sp. AFS040349]PGT80561.1 hypothetical protein COD11_20845 [Bacillus sp. AFS040349]
MLTFKNNKVASITTPEVKALIKVCVGEEYVKVAENLVDNCKSLRFEAPKGKRVRVVDIEEASKILSNKFPQHHIFKSPMLMREKLFDIERSQQG